MPGPDCRAKVRQRHLIAAQRTIEMSLSWAVKSTLYLFNHRIVAQYVGTYPLQKGTVDLDANSLARSAREIAGKQA